jgi:hypothetical protein
VERARSSFASKSGHGRATRGSFCHLMEIAITRLILGDMARHFLLFSSTPFSQRAAIERMPVRNVGSQLDNTLSQNLNGTEHFFIQIIKKEAQNDEEVTP